MTEDTIYTAECKGDISVTPQFLFYPNYIIFFLISMNWSVITFSNNQTMLFKTRKWELHFQYWWELSKYYIFFLYWVLYLDYLSKNSSNNNKASMQDLRTSCIMNDEKTGWKRNENQRLALVWGTWICEVMWPSNEILKRVKQRINILTMK